METAQFVISYRNALARSINSAAFTAVFLTAMLLLLTRQPTQAGSATWDLNPVNGDWNTAANWTPMTVPNSSTDTATFGSSNLTNVSTSASTAVGGIVFNPGASAFTITDPALPFPDDELFFDGAGITNNSGITQNFMIAGDDGSASNGLMELNNSSTAGNLTVFTCNGANSITGGGGNGGAVVFGGTSSATNSTFINNGATISGGSGGETTWSSTGSAGSSTFINNGGTASGASGGITIFNSGSMGSATLIANGGTGGGDGGLIVLNPGLTGTPRVEAFGNGTLQLNGGIGTVITVGSIEGNGLINFGFDSLTVGGNNLSTTFSGTISGSAGALTKTGNGKLTLSKASTYSGGTTISKGTLLVTNRTGSATGTGAVSVKAGTLGGTGRISGAVTVASGTTPAILAPGSGAKPGTITLLSTLTFNSHATYKVDLSSTTVTADQTVGKGVTINSGAQVSIDDLGTSTLASGTVFTIISNSAATPIAGTFSNLADGATLTVGSNTYKANYEGGTGNDLTLTVQ